MPFDGSDFPISRRDDPRRPLHLAVSGFRRWLRAQFCWMYDDAGASDVCEWSPERRAAVARLLQEAKGLILETRRWLQGSYRRPGRRHCAVGALRAAASRQKDISLGWSAQALLIQVAATRGFPSVEAMNDGLSHAEVLRAFDEASDLALGFV
jgi:hypothetical protein